MEVCFSCVKKQSAGINGSSKFKASMLLETSVFAGLKSTGKLICQSSTSVSSNAQVVSDSNFDGQYKLSIGLHGLQDSAVGDIRGSLRLTGNIRSQVSALSNIVPIRTDKFAGSLTRIKSIENFQATQKLYPIRDIETELDGSYLVDKNLNSIDLYSSIDEGISTGYYVENNKISQLISDDLLSYIQPSSTLTSGKFRYVCEVTPPMDAEESFIFIRASAPTRTFSSNLPPEYKIHNIRLVDPSGNLIVKYKDLVIRGDSNYNSSFQNFTTYISEPEKNNFLLRTWESGYPLMDAPDGYSLSIDITAQCFDDPFAPGFDEGYEDTCQLNPNTQHSGSNIENSIRISSIEICNSGGYDVYFASGVGIRKDSYLPFSTEVAKKGLRLTRLVNPIDLIPYDMGIYPQTSSVWETSEDGFGNKFNSTNVKNTKLLTSYIQNDDPFTFIRLVSSSPHQDSGRLTLRFTNLPPKEIFSPAEGAFAQSFFKHEYDAADIKLLSGDDIFFVIDEISLRVVAKKDANSRDYALDVVGYTDDKILHRTPIIGAYLQNKQTEYGLIDQNNNIIVNEQNVPITIVDYGVGNVPTISGFKNVDDLGLSSEPTSEKTQYFEAPLTPIEAGDHYKLSTLPVINSTSFKTYDIPLKIYLDDPDVGLPIDYGMSSYLENLFVDLYPIPSGASISNIQLVVTYKPANGLNLHTFAQGATELTRRTVHLYPSTRKLHDKIFDSNNVGQPLSRITDIPQAFTTPLSTKTNYSRRWYGVDGSVTNGPFNASQFDFDFYNPTVDFPFTEGFYDFNKVVGNTICPVGIGQLSGIFNGNITNKVVHNIGWRFNNSSIFSDTLPDFSGAYKTIDWTSLNNGSVDFRLDPLYGKIDDSFDKAIRLGSNGFINFGNINVSGGFTFYIRFSPDLPVSGSNFNLMNSGVILSQWDTQSNQGFVFGYEDGYLCGYAIKDGTILKAKDTTHYSQYKFPLSTMVTFKEPKINTCNSYEIVEAHNRNQIDKRLSGKDVTVVSPLYSVLSAAYAGELDPSVLIAERNTNCWLNDTKNITCVSTAHNAGDNSFLKAITMITKKHFIMASHNSTCPRDTDYLKPYDKQFCDINKPEGVDYLFVSKDNQRYIRNVVSAIPIPNTDIFIGVLDSELPDDIGFAKVLPLDYKSFIDIPVSNFANPDSVPQSNIYTVSINQQYRASVGKIRWTVLLNYLSIILATTEYPSFANAGDGFIDFIKPGDSGFPNFLLMDDELVFLFSHDNAAFGPFVSSPSNYRAINEAIETLSPGEGYSLTDFDLKNLINKTCPLLDNNKETIKIYTDNELSTSTWGKHRASIVPQTPVESGIISSFNPSNNNLVVGHCLASGVGLNMFVSEIGLSTNTNILPYSHTTNFAYNLPEKISYSDSLNDKTISETFRDSRYKFVDIDKFFSSKSTRYLPSTSNSTATNALYSFVDEDSDAWRLGAFKICQFSPDFDSFTKRIGKDYLCHTVINDGLPYSQRCNVVLPSNINALDLSYHSQIENDFLRFYISDLPSTGNFQSVHQRISKNLPRGYDFKEDAIIVDSIIEHETYNDILWPNGDIGPKLIVSIYAPSKDPDYAPSKKNWGLVNRSIHHIEPSGCWQKITSGFTYKDLIDESEPWAMFDVDRNTTELDSKYYLDDVNKMFLQYDVVYPSGSSYESTIRLHTAHIRLEHAITKSLSSNNRFNLVGSGEKKALENINLYTYGSVIVNGPGESFTDYLPLSIEGRLQDFASGTMPLLCSGAFVEEQSFNLYTMNVASISTIGSPVFGSMFGSAPILGPNLYVDGRDNRFDDQVLPLFVNTDILDQTSSGNMNLFTRTEAGLFDSQEQMNIYVRSSRPGTQIVFEESMSLFLDSPAPTRSTMDSMNLWIFGQDLRSIATDSMNLFVVNYPVIFGGSLSYTITWNSDFPGKNISLDDNEYAYLETNDEIRGVDLLCYGNCIDGTCDEQSLILHDLVWSAPSNCVDGGIFRAKNTYTNLSTSGFKTDVGYSGHFYGIRKLTGLLPHSPYLINVVGQAGSNISIDLPVEYIESEYGTDQSVNYTNRRISASTEDQNGLINTPQINERFGKSVSIKNNIACVGAPGHDLDYQEYDGQGNLTNITLANAGAVYIFRREDRPEGPTWPEGKQKSPWYLEEKLLLPSGMRKDYYDESQTNVIGNITLPTNITQRRWNVGQDGREFGHSVSVASTTDHQSFGSNKREVIVVGGPNAKWQRNFDNLNLSGVQIGLMVITDEFEERYPNNSTRPPSFYTYENILSSIENKDLLYRYFSSPAVKFDVKIVLCETTLNDVNFISKDFSEPKPNFIFKKRIERLRGAETPDKTQRVLNGMIDAFHEAFPYDDTKIHNNIPPILGLYVDNSASMTNAIGNAKNLFKNYYLEYSFASGLRDFYGVRSSGSFVEYIPSVDDDSENWIFMSTGILDNVLDTGRLVRDNQVRFITSGVGEEFFNPNLSEFNYPPESGGRVYIFEKESGSWNLIQEIRSPIVSYGHPDRFGHSVAISDNTEIISVGSPYMSECCKVYEYKPEQKDKLYQEIFSWLTYKNSATGGLKARYRNLISQYNNTLSVFGPDFANKELYASLDATEKFEARKYLNVQEYQNVFTYSYGDIGLYAPTWRFIPEHFAPTSRLGYSTAVNEDGSIVAFGAPTDSFNEWEDGRVWYMNNGYQEPSNYGNLNTSKISASWFNSTNAGAVRLFESRKYYPHNSALEYGIFGNLQEFMDFPEDSGHFNYLATAFSDKNFRKMGFTEVDIPQDAGLLFIITPKEDALSDEIADKLLNWLSLGDRNLVLVGNDPIWEKNGLYANSNLIVNKILKRLESRLRIIPAKNQYEASLTEDSFALPSYIPENSTTSYVVPAIKSAYGVGDIRIVFEENTSLFQNMTCFTKGVGLREESLGSEAPTRTTLNSKCELPLRHLGDLRAEWVSECAACDGRPFLYKTNWPYFFGTYVPPCCDIDPDQVSETVGQEPIPLMAAGKFINQTTIIPASPAASGFRTVYEILTERRIDTIFNEENIPSTPTFVWSSGENTSSYLNINDKVTSNTNGLFYQPPIFEDRQSLIMANAVSATEVITTEQVVSPRGYYCAEEVFENGAKRSQIAVLAGVTTESLETLKSQVSDKNINFYFNLVQIPGKTSIKIAQLGGWTRRTSFKDGYEDSYLFDLFQNLGFDVEQNVNKLIDAKHDVCWISNPAGLPSQEDLGNILSWLGTGDKKLIITYGEEESEVLLYKQLSDMIGSRIKPLYLSVLDKYPYVNTSTLEFNENHPVSNGTSVATSIETFVASTFSGIRFVPLRIVDNVVPICYDKADVRDDKLITEGFWKTNSGVTKVSFPAIAGSGYKIFITTICETPSETEILEIGGQNVSMNLSRAFPDEDFIFGYDFGDYPVSSLGFVHPANTNSSPLNKPVTASFDVKVLKDKNEINFYIANNKERLFTETSDYIPKTTRLLGISGILVPIEDVVTLTPRRVPVGVEAYRISDPLPEQIITERILLPILNDNTRYCPDEKDCAELLGGQNIADGPVIVAQEQEHFSDFLNGVARSRITVISDSSLVQGKYMGDENFRMSNETLTFLQSLYPETIWPNTNYGRQYTEKTKILSPERGSPQKYLSVSNNSGVVLRFGDNNGIAADINVFSNKESQYDPRYVKNTKQPWEEGDSRLEIERKIQAEKLRFLGIQNSYGATCRFSGIYDGKMYADAGIGGGIPEIMKDTGHDYLDFDFFPSGFPGDLFGYSVSLYKDKLLVGSPFSAYSDEDIRSWEYIVSGGSQSGIKLSHNGGAGAVYMFERNNKGSGIRGSITPWAFTQKFRPISINIGNESGEAIMGDRFGNSVAIDADILAIGAPGHDYGNKEIDGTGQFIRRSFNPEFNIPSRSVYDLGYSGSRNIYDPSEDIELVTNGGAIYTYENKVIDWPTKTQKWVFVEKLVENDPASTVETRSSMDMFGESVSINRSKRSDSDYTTIGSSRNNYPINSNGIGSAFVTDIMLRQQAPAIQSPNAYIDAYFFGETDPSGDPKVRLLFNNGTEANKKYYAQGLVYSNNQGEIFVEASGQDPVQKGFIEHRPYIKAVEGLYYYGIPNSGDLPLFVDGARNSSGNMNIFTKVDSIINVYNQMGLYTGAVTDYVSNGPSGLLLYVHTPEPINISESGLSLYMASGVGQSSDNLNLRIRGK